MAQNNVISCPVFYPTMEDMEGSFEAYIAKIERKFAHIGLARLVPPKGWTARRKGYKSGFDFDIPRPIRQVATGKRGLYRTLLIENKAMTLRDGFEPIATAEDNIAPKDVDPETLERKFWQNITMKPPLYGADVPGSLFDKSLKGWNLRHLDSMLANKLDQLGVTLEGVNTPFLYFGMWRSIFAWHTEDMDLHSVNFLHYGAPKQWYCIPPPYRQRFETLLKSLLPDMYRYCPEFVRHKELMISPGLLAQNNIPVVKAQQFPGEFMINFPGAYHSGFNCGYNCAESCNFATKTWLPIGLAARPCLCDRDTVRIQMSIFADVAPPRLRKQLLESDPTSSEESSGDDADKEASSSDDDSLASSSGRVRGRGGASGGRGMAAVRGGRTMTGGGRAMGATGAATKHHRESVDDRTARAEARAAAQAAAQAVQSRARRAAARASGRPPMRQAARNAVRVVNAEISDEDEEPPVVKRQPASSSEHSSGSHHTNVSLPVPPPAAIRRQKGQPGRPPRRAAAVARAAHKHEEATSTTPRPLVQKSVKRRADPAMQDGTAVRVSKRIKRSGVAKQLSRRLRAMASLL